MTWTGVTDGQKNNRLQLAKDCVNKSLSPLVQQKRKERKIENKKPSSRDWRTLRDVYVGRSNIS